MMTLKETTGGRMVYVFTAACPFCGTETTRVHRGDGCICNNPACRRTFDDPVFLEERVAAGWKLFVGVCEKCSHVTAHEHLETCEYFVCEKCGHNSFTQFERLPPTRVSRAHALELRKNLEPDKAEIDETLKKLRRDTGVLDL